MLQLMMLSCKDVFCILVRRLKTMLPQNTYVWELTHSTNFPWLDPLMAEELRNNIEALRLLEQEQSQVRGINPLGSCCES